MKSAALFAGILLVSLAGCVLAPPPLDDYALAKAAIEAARAVDAAKYSSGYFHKAETTYHQAQIYYEDREFEKAKSEFIHARELAEKAENSARLIRYKNGEVL